MAEGMTGRQYGVFNNKEDAVWTPQQNTFDGRDIPGVPPQSGPRPAPRPQGRTQTYDPAGGATDNALGRTATAATDRYYAPEQRQVRERRFAKVADSRGDYGQVRRDAGIQPMGDWEADLIRRNANTGNVSTRRGVQARAAAEKRIAGDKDRALKGTMGAYDSVSRHVGNMEGYENAAAIAANRDAAGIADTGLQNASYMHNTDANERTAMGRLGVDAENFARDNRRMDIREEIAGIPAVGTDFYSSMLNDPRYSGALGYSGGVPAARGVGATGPALGGVGPAGMAVGGDIVQPGRPQVGGSIGAAPGAAGAPTAANGVAPGATPGRAALGGSLGKGGAKDVKTAWENARTQWVENDGDARDFERQIPLGSQIPEPARLSEMNKRNAVLNSGVIDWGNWQGPPPTQLGDNWLDADAEIGGTKLSRAINTATAPADIITDALFSGPRTGGSDLFVYSKDGRRGVIQGGRDDPELMKLLEIRQNAQRAEQEASSALEARAKPAEPDIMDPNVPLTDIPGAVPYTPRPDAPALAPLPPRAAANNAARTAIAPIGLDATSVVGAAPEMGARGIPTALGENVPGRVPELPTRSPYPGPQTTMGQEAVQGVMEARARRQRAVEEAGRTGDVGALQGETVVPELAQAAAAELMQIQALIAEQGYSAPLVAMAGRAQQVLQQYQEQMATNRFYAPSLEMELSP